MGARTRVVGAAALAAPLLLLTGPADASTGPAHRPPEVAWVSDANARGDLASVLARYRCHGGDAGTHLWVSLKQGGGIDGRTAEELSRQPGTGGTARAWYDTNAVDRAMLTLTCDGRWQVQRYTLTPQKGRLERGTAFLQYCLFDSTADPMGLDLSQGFGYAYRLAAVRTRPHEGRYR